jgi:hypothetical protein
MRTMLLVALAALMLAAPSAQALPSGCHLGGGIGCLLDSVGSGAHDPPPTVQRLVGGLPDLVT